MNPEGSIPETDIAVLMVQLWRERFTGALRFENDSIIKIVYFKEGELLSASTNDSEDSFGEILFRGEKLSREHLKQAMNKRKDDESIADTLLALGFISRKELTWARRTQVVGVLRSILRWTAGNYAIVSDYLPKRQEGTSFHFPQVLLEVFLTETDRAPFDDAFEGGNVVLERTADFDEQYNFLGLNEEADEICALVDGTRSAGTVAGESPADSFNVLKLLYSLEVLGLLSRQGEEPVTVPAIFSEDSMQKDDDWSAIELAPKEPGTYDFETEATDDLSSEPFMRVRQKSRVPRFLLIVLALMLLGITLFMFRGALAPGIPEVLGQPSQGAALPSDGPSVGVTPIRGEEPSTPGNTVIEDSYTLRPVATPTPESTPEPVAPEATPEVAAADPIPASPPPAPPVPSPTPAGESDVEAVAFDPVRDRYDQMAREFQARMTEKPFSIQFAILCQTSSVTNAMKVDASNVWFVPVRFRDQPCYRAFWGRYDDRDAAESALSSLPANLRQGSAPAVVQTR
ncbi:MAG TPA: DUF4388 domain-containing protein [Thermoanaerobaculia bacterium]|nr:DUF4388 domain-containing protein [Thermoanaerobaculia bacterium]